MPDACDVDLSLHEGNNLVSFHALPDTDTELGVEFFFEDSDVSQVIGEGVSAVINNAGFWVGSLDAIDAESGYWLRTEVDTELETQGPMTSPSYTLHEASNLLSYPIF
jgi:hypothetical protein